MAQLMNDGVGTPAGLQHMSQPIGHPDVRLRDASWAGLEYRVSECWYAEHERGVASSAKIVNRNGVEVAIVDNKGEGGADSWAFASRADRLALVENISGLFEENVGEHVLDTTAGALLLALDDHRQFLAEGICVGFLPEQAPEFFLHTSMNFWNCEDDVARWSDLNNCPLWIVDLDQRRVRPALLP